MGEGGDGAEAEMVVLFDYLICLILVQVLRLAVLDDLCCGSWQKVRPKSQKFLLLATPLESLH